MPAGSSYMFYASLIFIIIITIKLNGLEMIDLKKVVIDTDGGADDAMAILLMMSKQSRASVMALTSLRGNTGVENATRNLLLVLEVANRTQIPVYMGSHNGLAYDEMLTHYFGYDGLGEAFVKPPLNLRGDDPAAVALAKLVKDNPGEITLLCIGPLTNVALAIHLYPRFLLDVGEVVMMAGSYKGRGNVKPGVEFNIFMDVEAAEFVFSKIPNGKLVTLFPLETSEENAYPMSWRLRDLGQLDSSFIRFLNKAERLGIAAAGDFWTAFDPMAAAALLDPSIVLGVKTARVSVETCGKRGRGAVFVDTASNCSNVRIVTRVAKLQLQSMLLSYLKG